jgi:hypothetical protein
MKKRSSSLLLGLVVFALMITQFQNCSNYSETTIGAGGGNSNIPFTSNNVFLSPKPNNIEVQPKEDKIVAGGDCDVGTFANHYIEFQLFATEGNPTYAPNTAIRVSNDATCTGGASASCFKYTGVKCEHGKYFAHIPVIAGIPSNTFGIPYRLVATLVVIDGAGVEKRDIYLPQSAQVLILGN